MSNVYKRFRGETEIQFITTALNLQAEITNYVCRDKVVPKKKRFLIGKILIDKVDEMVDNITFANSIRANTPEKFSKRRNYQEKAIANCFQLQNHIVRLEKCTETVTIKSLDKIIDLLCTEMKLLKGWYKKDKIIEDKK